MTLFLDIKNEDTIDIAIKQILNGKIIIFPTETVYALSCSAYDEESIRKIYEIKKRDKYKALSIFCYDVKQVEKITKMNSIAKTLAREFWPGPLTLLLESKNILPSIVNEDKKTLGIRIPANKFALSLLKKIKMPIIATSVNISGNSAANSVNEIEGDILEKVDLIIDGGESPIKIPSTIIDLSYNKMEIIREGSINSKMIFNLIDNVGTNE